MGEFIFKSIVVTSSSSYNELINQNIDGMCEYLNIDSENAIAIGNGYDDICMCDVVGTSVAVGNANNVLKEAATYITDNTENDGVAKILEKLCLED